MINIVYPQQVKTPSEKTSYLYRLYEKLRLQHNEMGSKYHDKIISKQEWASYLSKFNIKHDLIINDLLTARAALKSDNFWDINLETAFTP